MSEIYKACFDILQRTQSIFEFYLKDINFFSQSLVNALSAFGISIDWVTLDVILPVGISFYTFQALTIDVYKKQIEACKDPIAFCAFISFFPQLVAGPIERAENPLTQIMKKRSLDYELAIDGCKQIIWGFFKPMHNTLLHSHSITMNIFK